MGDEKTRTLVDEKVEAFWATQKKSACPDDIVRDLSIEVISKYLNPGEKVLDIGCGNGYCTYQFAAKPIAHITGADFSNEMIDAANDGKKIYPQDIAGKVDFKRADARDLQFDDGSMDTVITIRCLINIPELNDKKRALSEIARVLKTDGKYLMCENTLQGLNRLNKLRLKFGLPEIKMRWHNTYLDENWLNSVLSKDFEICKVDHFASLYYLITRIINAKLAAIEGKEPRYDHPINKIAKDLSSTLKPYGEFAPMRLYVLKKK